MKSRLSAGLLVYRHGSSGTEVFLVHPGGPFWTHRDLAVWSLPKGEVCEGEEALDTALREFAEETGQPAPAGPYLPLTPVKQAGGKTVQAWCVEGAVDAAAVRSNTFTLEWPPRSGKLREFPEVDRAAWFSLADARVKLNAAQAAFIDQLEALLARKTPRGI